MIDRNNYDFALAQLRHLYQQMVSGTMGGDLASIAGGLLGPAIVALERAVGDVPSSPKRLRISGPKQLREEVVRYRIEDAAHRSGITVERIREIEADGEPTVFEAESLARTYAVPLEAIVDTGYELDEADPLARALEWNSRDGRSFPLNRRLLDCVNAARDAQVLVAMDADVKLDGGTLYWVICGETGPDDFPLDAVPFERRGIVALYASRLYSRGKISRDELAEFLGVTPAEDVGAVLDYY